MYIIGKIEKPIKFISAGKFIAPDGWTHNERTIDTYEIIIVFRGSLHISQEKRDYSLKKQGALFLLPGVPHKGFQESERGTVFFWAHFLFESARIVSDYEVREIIMKSGAEPHKKNFEGSVVLPVYSEKFNSERIGVLCGQINHVCESSYYSRDAVNYLTTSLLIEMTNDAIKNKFNTETSKSGKLPQILEWIRINAHKNISLADVAHEFNYSREYLSRFFKKTTGMNIQYYINKIKIDKAKELLYITDESIREIAVKLGFSDEKYFMKLFKRHENITPSQYRNSYNKAHFNNH